MAPELSLAFSIQSSPGVYALLLGSGVSRAARIPTGWEVVLDLVRKVARADSADCEPDPAAWYAAQYGAEPGYSQLLDALAKTPSERQQILRSYFEPSEEERQESAKAPTKAHRAIANLAASGHIRVILTTNFDRLMERALEDAGVAPVVISTPDQIEGAVPLAHMKCCIVKLHGDYLDTRILNTPEELARYDPRLDRLLDRVFDEFGLITCGWSAEWDEALRNAIERTPSRRYSTFFAARGALGERGEALRTRRGGQQIAITDADEFFDGLVQKVRAIEEFAQPHPLSVKAAVAACKRYLAEPEVSRIRLADLISDESRRVCSELVSTPLANTSEEVNTASVTARVRRYEGVCQTLVAIAFEVGRWGDVAAVKQLASVQRRLYATKASQGITFWLAFQGYPVTLVTYAALLGTSLERRCGHFGSLLAGELEASHGNASLAVDVVPPFRLLEDFRWGQQLEGMQRRHAPLNDWLCEFFWRQLGDCFDSRSDFDRRFDWVEVILAMASHKLSPPTFNPSFHPPGRYGYRHESRKKILNETRASIQTLGAKSPYVSANCFGKDAADVGQAIEEFESWVTGLGRSGWL